jgi:hypothetical protein
MRKMTFCYLWPQANRGRRRLGGVAALATLRVRGPGELGKTERSRRETRRSLYKEGKITGSGHSWWPARAPMGGGAPVNFRPWEGAGEVRLSEAELVVVSVGSGVDGGSGLGSGGGTGRRGLVPAARRRRRGAAGAEGEQARGEAQTAVL